MRIGIFGGSFNPPHLGHKKLALEMKKTAELDRIIIIPACRPPHKEGAELASGKDRMKMCSLLFSEDFFTVSDIELKREGKSYTVDTLTELKKLYGEDELFLIIGSDMLLSFHKWYRYKDILSMAKLAVETREESISSDELERYMKDVLFLGKDEYVICDTEPFECSSTYVRERISSDESLKELLSETVEKYVRAKGLYTDKYSKYKAFLREKLDEYRYIHSLGVADSALELALIYGADAEKAYFAGLVHDIMKNTSPENQLQIMKNGGIILSQVEENNKALWHAMAGEAYLRDEMKIYDEEILGAVRYHTTGKSNMTLLEKVIYVADYISEERNYPDVDVMRDLSFNAGLDEAALYALKFSFGKFSREERVIHTDSVDYYNELVMKGRSKNDRA